MPRAYLLGRSPWFSASVHVAGFFFAMALVAAALGLGVLTDAAADAARLMFFVFLLIGFVPLLQAVTRETR